MSGENRRSLISVLVLMTLNEYVSIPFVFKLSVCRNKRMLALVNLTFLFLYEALGSLFF